MNKMLQGRRGLEPLTTPRRGRLQITALLCLFGILLLLLLFLFLFLFLFLYYIVLYYSIPLYY